MGKAARGKRDLREAGSLPDRFDFGPHHLVRSTAQRSAPVTDVFGIHDFNQTRERPCPECGGEVVYQYGNWHCVGERDWENNSCDWTTARDLPGGNRETLEKCPDCGARVIYNGNYLCERWGGECWWALPHPARKTADRELALRLTGGTS